MTIPAWHDVVVLAQQGDGADASAWLLPMMLLSLLVLYFVMVQQPARRERAAHELALKNLKKNDRVLTTGGIFGVVTNVQADAQEVTIRVDEANNTRLRVTLASIGRVLGDEGSSAASEKEAK